MSEPEKVRLGEGMGGDFLQRVNAIGREHMVAFETRIMSSRLESSLEGSHE